MQNSLLWLLECSEMLLGSFLGHFKCIVWLLGVVGSCQGVSMVFEVIFSAFLGMFKGASQSVP